MKELLLDIKIKYRNNIPVTDDEEKIVYEFVGLYQLDEGIEFEEAVDQLYECLYGCE